MTDQIDTETPETTDAPKVDLDVNVEGDTTPQTPETGTDEVEDPA
jgi:hypothetical protein